VRGEVEGGAGGDGMRGRGGGGMGAGVLWFGGVGRLGRLLSANVTSLYLGLCRSVLKSLP